LGHEIETWEGVGGAVPAQPRTFTAALTGTTDQIEWAERIRRRVNADFDRVAAAFRAVAAGQEPARRADTELILAILADQRNDVMSRTRAGYFIHDWQEIGDQVRQLIYNDARFAEIQQPQAAGGGGDLSGGPDAIFRVTETRGVITSLPVSDIGIGGVCAPARSSTSSMGRGRRRPPVELAGSLCSAIRRRELHRLRISQNQPSSLTVAAP
jgi:hypothetical protein